MSIPRSWSTLRPRMGLLVVCGLVTSAAIPGFAEEPAHRAAPPTRAATPPEAAGCGEWRALELEACERVAACRTGQAPARQSVALYDRLEARAAQEVESHCDALACRNTSTRRDRNHLECAGAERLCMTRSLEYRCEASRAPAPSATPTRAPAGGEGGHRVVLDADAVVAARAQEADLATEGPLALGGEEVAWGEALQLDPSRGTGAGDGRCAFPFRYGVVNHGPGAAGPHAYRLHLQDGEVLAEDASAGVTSGASDVLAGSVVLAPGRHMLYVDLDPDDDVVETDETNNRRRIRADLADGCDEAQDSGVRTRTSTRTGPRPSGTPARSGQEDPGVRRDTSTRAGPRPGAAPVAEDEEAHRAPPPQGKPAPGGEPHRASPGKAVPACEPRLSATRASAVTRAGGRISAIAAWEVNALAMHGRGYRWHNAQDKTSECEFLVGWSCTVAGRPCKGGL